MTTPEGGYLDTDRPVGSSGGGGRVRSGGALNHQFSVGYAVMMNGIADIFGGDADFQQAMEIKESVERVLELLDNGGGGRRQGGRRSGYRNARVVSNGSIRNLQNLSSIRKVGTAREALSAFRGGAGSARAAFMSNIADYSDVGERYNRRGRGRGRSRGRSTARKGASTMSRAARIYRVVRWIPGVPG